MDTYTNVAEKVFLSGNILYSRALGILLSTCIKPHVVQLYLFVQAFNGIMVCK